MSDQEATTALPVEGVPEGTGSQEAQPETQVPAESQDTTGTTQVEGNVNNKPQVPEAQRKKPSDFYNERREIKNLKSTVQSYGQRMDEIASLLRDIKTPTNPAAPGAKQGFDTNRFWTKPDEVLFERESKLREEIKALQQEFVELKDSKTRTEQAQSEREALEMLFPKSSPDSDEPLEERIENSERKEMLDRVFKTNPALDRLMRIDPRGAAQLALLVLKEQRPAQSPKTIAKSLMGNVARGNPSAGVKQKVSVEDLVSELKAMTKDTEGKPYLRYNAEFKKRRGDLVKQIEKLAQEKSA